MSVNEAIETQLRLVDHVNGAKLNDKTRVFEDVVFRSLQHGATYYWSQDFVRLLEGQANMLPEDAVLNMTDFLSEAGFIFFEKPVFMPKDPTVEQRFTEWEHSWHEDQIKIHSGIGEASEITSNLGLALDDYHKPDGSIDVQKIRQFRTNRGKGTLKMRDTLTGKVSERTITEDELHHLIKSGQAKLGEVGDALDKWKSELERWHSKLEDNALVAISWVMVNEADHPTVYFIWWTQEKVLPHSIRLYPELIFPWYLDRNLQFLTNLAVDSELEDDPTRLMQALKYACASVLFMNQKVFTHSDERPNRAVRHRITKWRPDPIVKVIRLRRAQQHANSNPEHDSPEHAFQWMVTGHWRNQWYSASNTHRTIWIAPFIKGPPDKPLKEPRARIYAVVR